METNLKQLRCGECGQYLHKIFQRENGELVIQCIQCKSSTEVIITEPKIILRNNSGSGTLCNF